MKANKAAAMQILHSGSISRASRCTCVISAGSTELPADPKCQFSGFPRTTRSPFQRLICEICNFCADFAVSAYRC